MTSALSLPVAPGTGDSVARGRFASWAPAVILTGYLLAAVAVTWRLWADPSSAIVAGNVTDNDLFAWFMRYEAIAVSHGRIPALITTAMNAPTGISVMWNTSMLLPGILLTPVTLLAGPQVSLTVLLTVGFAGSAASMFYLLRRVNVSLVAAAVGGAVYGFSPAVLHSAVGHYNLQFAVLPPLIIEAGLRLCVGTPRRWRDGIRLGLLITAQLFISEELLTGTMIAGVLLVTVLAGSRPRLVVAHAAQAARGLAIAAGVTLLLAGWPLAIQFFGPLTQRGSSFLPNFFENDLAGFVLPSASQWLHTSATAAAAARYQGGVPEYVGYLGIPLLLVLSCAVVAFWRHLALRAAAVTSAVLMLLSLGGRLLLNGKVHDGVPLPWAWVAHLPLLQLALPNRLSILADGGAAAALALAIDLVWVRLGRSPVVIALVAAVVAFAVAPLIPVPLPQSNAQALPAGWTTAFHALHLPPGATVVIIPVPTATLTSALRWQAQSGAQISLVGGYFQGPAWNGHAYIDGNGLPPLGTFLNGLYAGNVVGTPPGPAQALAGFRRWHPAAIVAVAGQRPALQGYLVSVLGPPVLTTGDILVWRRLPAST